MIDFFAKLNPLRKTPSYRRIEEMEARLATKEAVATGLELTISQKSSYIKEAANRLEETAEEVLHGFDKYRGKPNVQS